MKKEAEFLEKMFQVLHNKEEILQFLKDEKLITKDTVSAILLEHTNTHASSIAKTLHELQVSDDLQLVSYNWTLLPREIMRLTLVSMEAKKDFLYSV